MFKVLIWDYTGVSASWLNQVADEKDIEVVGTITPSEPVPKVLLERDAWDWLLIFEQGMRNFFDTTIQTLKLPLDRVIYALDMVSWLQRPKAIYALINPQGGGGGVYFLHLHFALNHQLNKFITCTVEDLSYVGTSQDIAIMQNMHITRKNWAADEMKSFKELAKKYYDVDDSSGYFLDLGANIGTTGIFFLRKLAPNLKLFAVEPDSENFKLLRTNLILNDLEDKVTLVNCGLGDKVDEMTMYRYLENPGMNSFLLNDDDLPTEKIKTVPLDFLLAENKIAPADVKYIWIDTEGFEAQVLLGAKNLLKENPAPIFMECNLGAWDKSGCFEDMMTLLAEHYSHFIQFKSQGFFNDGEQTLHSLEDLQTMERPHGGFGQIGDIFLIRKGAID